ncbi:unnamed protein product [Parnassius mnemosyne]|uniref:MADF domain-containing protein n=1 Tax=Parnassius mnemosyne TaxID=213953 RepID=A0AAV1KMG9_9NEOP
MNIDTERVISEVHLRPQLWDLSCEHYKDRDAKIKAWLEVCQAITQNYDELSDNEKKLIEKQVRQRWKTARDAYVRSKATLKNIKSGSGGGNIKKYVFFDCMHFLDKNQVVNTEDSILTSQDTVNESRANSEPPTIDTGEGSSSSTSSIQNALPLTFEGLNTSRTNETAASRRKNVYRKRKRIPDEDENFGKEMLNIFKENTKLIQNDDLSFFCSLLPIMQTFTTHQKLLFRSEVLKIAIEISSANSSSEGRPGTSHTSSTMSEH